MRDSRERTDEREQTAQEAQERGRREKKEKSKTWKCIMRLFGHRDFLISVLSFCGLRFAAASPHQHSAPAESLQREVHESRETDHSRKRGADRMREIHAFRVAYTRLLLGGIRKALQRASGSETRSPCRQAIADESTRLKADRQTQRKTDSGVCDRHTPASCTLDLIV